MSATAATSHRMSPDEEDPNRQGNTEDTADKKGSATSSKSNKSPTKSSSPPGQAKKDGKKSDMTRSKSNNGNDRSNSKSNNQKNDKQSTNNKSSQNKKGTNSGGDKQKKQSEQSKQNKEKKDDSGSGEPTQTCGSCSGEFTDLHYCVNFSESICAKCRGKYIMEQVEEFTKAREEANTNQRQVVKKVAELTVTLEQNSRNELSCYRAIDNDFKEIEKALIKRKAELKKEVKQRHSEIAKPVKESRRELDKELNNLMSKFECVSRISLPPSGGHSSAYMRMSNSDCANVCASIARLSECTRSFQDLKKKASDAGVVPQLEYCVEECGDQFRQSIMEYGKVQEKKEEGDEDEAESGEKKEPEEDANDDRKKTDDESDEEGQRGKSSRTGRKTAATNRDEEDE